MFTVKVTWSVNHPSALYQNVCQLLFFFCLHFANLNPASCFHLCQKPHPRNHHQQAQRQRRLPRCPQRLHRGCTWQILNKKKQLFCSSVSKTASSDFWLCCYFFFPPCRKWPRRTSWLCWRAMPQRSAAAPERCWRGERKNNRCTQHNNIIPTLTFLRLTRQRTQRPRVCVLHWPRSTRHSGFSQWWCELEFCFSFGTWK